MKSLLLLKITVLALLLLAPQQVPGAATQALPLVSASSVSAEPVLRQLNAELRRLSLTLPESQKVSKQQQQHIEALWQQLFAHSQSHTMNKLYNQYQVLLQHSLHSNTAAEAEAQARQLTALRQRLLAAMTLQQQ